MHDLSPHALRRDHILAEAELLGKFPPGRRGFWRESYDRDPASTQQVLATLTGFVPAPSADPPSRITRGGMPASQLRVPPTGELAMAGTPSGDGPPLEVVAGWTNAMFPETRARSSSRVTRANDA